jgi:spermidine/putrescine transport system substrate-binding protein
MENWQMSIFERTVNRRGLLSGATGLAAAAAGLGGSTFSAGRAFAQSKLPSPLVTHCICSTWCREGDMAIFEKQYDVKVQRSCWTSHLNTLTRMATGGGEMWDVVMGHHAFLYPLMRRGLLHELDLGKVPNTKELFPQFTKMSHATYDGKTYGIPYVWTFDSVVYNADHISDVDSWGVLFDEKYAGKVALRDDAQNAIQLAALYLGHKDPSMLSTEDLKEIKDFLIAKKPVFRRFWTGYSEAISMLRSGEVWALSGWRPMWWELAREGLNMKLAIPKEKAIGALLYNVVSAETKVLPTAYAYLNWMIDTEWGAATGRDQGYFSTSRKALAGLDEKLIKTLGYDDIDNVLKDVHFLEYPVNLNEWLQVWTEVKAA